MANQQTGNRNSQKTWEPPKPRPPLTIGGFYEEDGETLKESLFDTTACGIAKTLFIDNVNSGVSKTQLRRLFDEVKRFKQILEVSPEEWPNQKPYIKMIKAKVSYTVARAVKNNRNEEGAYKNLASFINQGIDLCESVRDYYIFITLFEAVYGYYYKINTKRD